MSVENQTPAVETNDNLIPESGWIKKLISSAKEFLWDDTVNNFLDWIKKIPFLWNYIAQILEESKEGREELASELEENWESSEWVQGSPEIFADFLNTYTEKFNIPEWLIVRLINKEGSQWNTKTPPTDWSTAFWLGQHVEWTWNEVQQEIKEADWYDIWEFKNTDPEAQIYATAYYLSKMSKIDGWEYAMMYYNTWPGIKNISQETALEFAAINPAISNKIPWVRVKGEKILEWEEFITPQTYFAAAKAYYNDVPYDPDVQFA